MDYTIKFNFNAISKRGAIIGRSGEIDIETDASIEQIKESIQVKNLIAHEMANACKKKVFSVEITDISEIINNPLPVKGGNKTERR